MNHVPRAEIEAALARVVAERQARNEPSLLERFFRWLGDTFSAPDMGALPPVLRWVVTVALALALALLLARLLRRLERRRARTETAVLGQDRRRRVADLRAEALAAAARGELALALRLQVFALLLGLGERGDLRFRPAWTNRELLRRGEPGPEAARVLEPLVRELEPKEFGREATTLADVRRLEELCARFLGPLEAVEGAAAPAAGGLP